MNLREFAEKHSVKSEPKNPITVKNFDEVMEKIRYLKGKSADLYWTGSMASLKKFRALLDEGEAQE